MGTTVLKAQVLDAIDDTPKLQRRYKINITKVLKGPKTLIKFRNLYTHLNSQMLCGYEHPTPFSTDEYVISVRRYETYLFTTRCDFNVKWDSLSYEDTKGIEGGFEDACD
ncbi:UNVERIFIED_CONTAM: hypothetical protein K2H54_047632 [Gekko kuhli]